MNIETAKYRLIQLITEIQSESLIQKLLFLIHQFRQPFETELEQNIQQNDLLAIGQIPTPTVLTIQDLKHQQRYSTKSLRTAYTKRDRSIWLDENLEELLVAIK